MSAENFMRLIRKTIADGVLDGCKITASGATIHIAAGHIVAGGALVEVDATSLTVSASGELVLKINTAAENDAQILARSATALTKQDLTNGGTVYELKLAAYTYSGGTVTINGKTPSGGSGGGDSSGEVKKNGTVVSKVSSTVSSPTVHYAVEYASVRNGTALSVTLNFAAWLNSSGSTLGTGIKLTIYARLNGGGWKSVVIKENSASWKGTTRHAASLTLTGTASGSSATVELYVTRSGSSYSGTAGTLGSASSPKKYTVSI